MKTKKVAQFNWVQANDEVWVKTLYEPKNRRIFAAKIKFHGGHEKNHQVTINHVLNGEERPMNYVVGLTLNHAKQIGDALLSNCFEQGD